MISSVPIKPVISIILAFRNESKFLSDCLTSLDAQTLPRDEWELILVDGRSEDDSSETAKRYVSEHPNSKFVDNAARIVTAGWNRGIETARGEYFHIANGHSIYEPDFLFNAKGLLRDDPKIHALGGRIYKIGLTSSSQAISAAMNTPFAIGGSYYRIGTEPRQVNVIGQGIYKSDLTGLIGPYDETLGRSGDWEFNYRICSNGFRMIFNPKLVVRVFSRAGFRASVIQMFRTGFWKVRIWAKHPASILPRHLVPPVFVAWLVLLPLIAVLFGSNIAVFWAVPLVPYIILSLLYAGAGRAEKANFFLTALAFPVIHLSYGLGFLTGLIRWGAHFFIDAHQDKAGR